MTSLAEKKRLVAIESAERALEQIDRLVAAVCESPIEELFLTALIARGCWREKLEFAHSHPLEILMQLCSGSGMTIASQQVKIGSHRVDFLLAHDRYAGEPPVCVAVECDGHDFHEKTKEQAARDKQRDREILGHGVIVMRFTGAEVWRDAGGCVDEVLSFIDAEWSDSANRCMERIEREKEIARKEAAE